MTINDRISELIKLLNIKQKDFANRLNLKPNTLSMIKNNKRNVTERTISDIVREFNVNKEWLVNGTGEVFNSSTNNKNYIDELIKQYNLSPSDKKVLETYINMDENNRNLFYTFIKSINKSL